MSTVDSLNKAGVRKWDSHLCYIKLWLQLPSCTRHDLTLDLSNPCTVQSKNGIFLWTKFDLTNTLIPLGVSAPCVAQLRNSLWWSHPNPVPVTLKVQRKAHQLPEFVPEDSSPPDGPGLSATFLVMNRSCWVDSFYNGCMPKAVVFKSGSSRCFQGHQRRVGWAKAQLSTGVADLLSAFIYEDSSWSCSSKRFHIWRF